MAGILLAGFGGQGILFAGKQLIVAGMKNGKEVSWLPSYGPEMRGGTCNCSVNIDDEPIGSPLVTTPEILIAMNKPSFEKFLPKVEQGGTVVYDETLITSQEAADTDRNDLHIFGIPATGLANENGFPKLANCIMLGRLVRVTGLFEFSFFRDSIRAASPKSRPELGEMNARAFTIGYEYEHESKN